MTSNNTLEDQLEAAAKVLLKEIIDGKGDLQEKGNLFKVVTTYYAIRQKHDVPSDADDEGEEDPGGQSIRQLGEAFRGHSNGRQNSV